MQHRQIVFTTLFPANQYPSEAVQPTMRSFYHPTSSSESGLLSQRLRLLTAWSNMQCVVKLIGDCRDLVAGITCIQTQVLAMVRPYLRTFYRDALQRRFHQLAVMAIRPGHFDAKRNAFTVGQKTAFGACFSAVGRISSDFFPRPAVLSSSLRPSPATSKQFLDSCRIPRARFSTIVETGLPGPTPETSNERSNRNKFPSRQGLSIGSRYEQQTKWRRTLCGRRPVSVRRPGDGGSHALESKAQYEPKVRPSLDIRSSIPPSQGIITNLQQNEHNNFLFLG